MRSQIQRAAGAGGDGSGTTGSRMLAIIQDTYGEEAADVLRLQEIDWPEGWGELIRVRAAGVHIGDWHVMTGRPYLLRVVGFGFRAPKVPVRGMDVAGTVDAVGTTSPGSGPVRTCSAPATARSPNSCPHSKTRWPPSQPT